jgi:hypothetical protein
MIIEMQKWLSCHPLISTYSLCQDGAIPEYLQSFTLANSCIELAHRIHKSALAHAATRNGRIQFIIRRNDDPYVQFFTFGLTGKEIEVKEPLGSDLSFAIKRRIKDVLTSLIEELYTTKACDSYRAVEGGLHNLYGNLERVEDLQRELTK